MKGSELIDLWERAKKAVDDGADRGIALPGGEMGACVRDAYDVTWDGCSVCTFMERHLDIQYVANCTSEKRWTLRPCILTTYGKKHNNGWCTNIDDIKPAFDYEVNVIKSPAEKLAAGELGCKRFGVYVFAPKEIRDRHFFDDFGKADDFARRLAKEKADGIAKEEPANRYVRTIVKDDEQRARELSVLRFYPYYVHSHRYTNAIVVDAEY